MVKEGLEVIGLLAGDLDSELTIHQISKKLKKSYAFTNRYVRELISQGILRRKIVGAAILCSLNFSNEETIGLLSLLSIKKKKDYILSLPKSRAGDLEKSDLMCSSGSFYCAYLCHDSLVIVTDTPEKYPASKIGSLKTLSRTPGDFLMSFSTLNISDITVMKNHEAFWSLIARVKR